MTRFGVHRLRAPPWHGLRMVLDLERPVRRGEGPCARRTAMRRPGRVVRKGTIGLLGVVVALLAALALSASAGGERFATLQSPLHLISLPHGSLSGFGNPLLMSPDDLALFSDGQETFIEVENLPQLGPLFNSRSCATCHFQPALGGSGAFINEIRIRNNTRPGPLQIFASDNILRLGPQTQGSAT